jgi:hypothetical protein
MAQRVGIRKPGAQKSNKTRFRKLKRPENLGGKNFWMDPLQRPNWTMNRTYVFREELEDFAE